MFGEGLSYKNKVINPLFTDAVVIAIFTDLNQATHALLSSLRCQYVVVFRWWGWAWLSACHSEWSPERQTEFPAPPSSPHWALLSGSGDSGGWVGWLELETGSEPAEQSQRVTPSRAGRARPPSRYNQQLGNDEHTRTCEGGGRGCT